MWLGLKGMGGKSRLLLLLGLAVAMLLLHPQHKFAAACATAGNLQCMVG